MVVRQLTPQDDLVLDRIGGETGYDLHDRGTGFSARSMPPERLELPRSAYRVDVTNPLVVNGRVLLEQAVVRQWFGQRGGARVYRFLDPDGAPLSVLELRAYRVLVDAPLEDPA